jgi:hypothetical protein
LAFITSNLCVYDFEIKIAQSLEKIQMYPYKIVVQFGEEALGLGIAEGFAQQE